jgi:hypothetical protein
MDAVGAIMLGPRRQNIRLVERMDDEQHARLRNTLAAPV